MESRSLSSHRGADCLERPLGSSRRECQDRLIVLGQSHLRRVLAGYVADDHH